MGTESEGEEVYCFSFLPIRRPQELPRHCLWLQVKRARNEDAWARNANMCDRPGGPVSFTDFDALTVPQAYCEVKDFVIAYGQDSKITCRFLTRSQNPLIPNYP